MRVQIFKNTLEPQILRGRDIDSYSGERMWCRWERNIKAVGGMQLQGEWSELTYTTHQRTASVQLHACSRWWHRKSFLYISNIWMPWMDFVKGLKRKERWQRCGGASEKIQTNKQKKNRLADSRKINKNAPTCFSLLSICFVLWEIKWRCLEFFHPI